MRFFSLFVFLLVSIFNVVGASSTIEDAYSTFESDYSQQQHRISHVSNSSYENESYSTVDEFFNKIKSFIDFFEFNEYKKFKDNKNQSGKSVFINHKNHFSYYHYRTLKSFLYASKNSVGNCPSVSKQILYQVFLI